MAHRRRLKLPKVLGVSLPLAILAGFVGYKLYKGRATKGTRLAGLDHWRGSMKSMYSPAPTLIGQARFPSVPYPATTPGASVPNALTPIGRSEDIKARIRGHWPINQIVGMA